MTKFYPVTHYFGLGITAIALICSAILVMDHDTQKCLYQINGSDWSQCVPDHSWACTGPAMDVEVNMSTGLVNFDVTCPWRKGTAILSYLSFVMTGIYLVIYALTPKFRATYAINLQLLAGVLAFGTLLAGFIAELTDILIGNDNLPDHFSQPGVRVRSAQTPFDFTLGFQFVMMVAVLVLVVLNYKTNYIAGKKALLDEESEYQKFYSVRNTAANTIM